MIRTGAHRHVAQECTPQQRQVEVVLHPLEEVPQAVHAHLQRGAGSGYVCSSHSPGLHCRSSPRRPTNGGSCTSAQSDKAAWNWDRVTSLRSNSAAMTTSHGRQHYSGGQPWVPCVYLSLHAFFSHDGRDPLITATLPSAARLSVGSIRDILQGAFVNGHSQTHRQDLNTTFSLCVCQALLQALHRLSANNL